MTRRRAGGAAVGGAATGAMSIGTTSIGAPGFGGTAIGAPATGAMTMGTTAFGAPALGETAIVTPATAAPAIYAISASAIVATALAAALVGCAVRGDGGSAAGRFEPEVFGSTSTYARELETPPPTTCEAARRALLSQGFTIATATAERVNGRKNFQPKSETHVEIEFNIVCAPVGRGGRQTVAFVTALQDRYALKKSNNSASVGVPVLGSLSLPIISSDDAMVKVASETITSAPFYDRFFLLLNRYLEEALDTGEPQGETIAPVATPASQEPGAPSAAASAASAAAPTRTAPAASAAPASAPASPPT